MSTSVARHHTDWLSLIEVSGPFLTLPVLKRALPQGLEPVDRDVVDELRRAHQEWQADGGLHGEWVRWVLASLLGFDDETLRAGQAVPPTLEHVASEHGETLRPDLVVVDPSQNGKVVPRLLVTVWPRDIALDDKPADRRWAATPLDRMAELLRAKGARLGLVTNGERWTLVHAAVGGPTTYATWEASIWLEDRPTLNAFWTLVSAERFFNRAETDTLEALFDESANAEQEVTDQLGRQVRHAVELLVDAFGRANRSHQGKLLEGIPEGEIYSAAVTVMMRLVFLLCAEERGLFLLGDPLYDNTYAVSTLRAQLQEDADRHGEEPLERRSSAWHRLLATFRMVYAGVEHENLRLPAYGGMLFDPDRYPFLEGRKKGEPWQEHPARPLPLDDRTVLHILDALQVLRFRQRGGVTEARRLSFRALDVEQIGHVYEGLLDHTVVEATDPAVGLEGRLEPEVALAELEEKAHGERTAFVEWLVEQTGRTTKAIEKSLDAPLEAHERALLRAACDMDAQLAERVAPFHALLRHDLRGLPQVYLAGGVYVTKTLERRSSGTYYTPRSLAEEMVRYALEPLVYKPGPAEGADANEWKLRPAAELLELKVCDMAMGSGAFLVASCRYLADRLAEAWGELGDAPITVEGDPAGGRPDELLVPDDAEDRAVLAKRLVADRCLYGVDKNPMAVEMAKLSMWLITLAKDRPFSFVDHALRCGDSLLGITDLSQIENLHIDPARGRELFHGQLFDYRSIFAPAVERAVEKRRALAAFPVVTLRDTQEKERLFHEAEQELEALKVVGNVIVGAAISTASLGEQAFERHLLSAADDVAAALDFERKESDRKVRLESLHWDAVEWLNAGRPAMQEDRRTFHWPLEFPEVFVRSGFDAIVGNPPFRGGSMFGTDLGSDYRAHVVAFIGGRIIGRVDLCAYFFNRAADLASSSAEIALLATSSISEGHTRRAAPEKLLGRGLTIRRAVKQFPWPGNTALLVALVWLHNGQWKGPVELNGSQVAGISSYLTPDIGAEPHRLLQSVKSFRGVEIRGKGFILSKEERDQLSAESPTTDEVVRPYLSGIDLNSSPGISPRRWVINFGARTREEAAKYSACFERVERLVKPGRAKIRGPIHEQAFWRFWDKRQDNFREIARQPHVIVRAADSTAWVWAIIPNHVFVIGHKVLVVKGFSFALFALLQSEFHRLWTMRYGSSIGAGMAYRPSEVLETYPTCSETQELEVAGRTFESERSRCMKELSEGLTSIHNRLNDPSDDSVCARMIREAYRGLNEAVTAAYGWEDFDLGQAFHADEAAVRFTIAPAARVEMLDRLLELNHERYAAEVAAGLHDRKKGAKRKRNPVVVGDQTTLDGMS